MLSSYTILSEDFLNKNLFNKLENGGYAFKHTLYFQIIVKKCN